VDRRLVAGSTAKLLQGDQMNLRTCGNPCPTYRLGGAAVGDIVEWAEWSTRIANPQSVGLDLKSKGA